jgi:hypothetical protein
MATQKITGLKKITEAQQKLNEAQQNFNEAQQEINVGQREINGALCYVDWHSIMAVKALTKALQSAGVLTDAQVQEVKMELRRAYYTSGSVASIDPPGCGVDFKKEGEGEEDPSETNPTSSETNPASSEIKAA